MKKSILFSLIILTLFLGIGLLSTSTNSVEAAIVNYSGCKPGCTCLRCTADGYCPPPICLPYSFSSSYTKGQIALTCKISWPVYDYEKCITKPKNIPTNANITQMSGQVILKNITPFLYPDRIEKLNCNTETDVCTFSYNYPFWDIKEINISGKYFPTYSNLPIPTDTPMPPPTIVYKVVAPRI